MELIISLIQTYLSINDATRFSGNVADWVFDKVNKWSKQADSKTIEAQIAKLINLTEAEIRLLTAKAVAKNPRTKVPLAQREELTGILINMTRNIRSQTSLGILPGDGSFLRDEMILDQLLRNIAPVRHVNQPVADKSPWILKQHLGMGSFGEVWKAENPYYPTPRAYKFFTRDGSGEWLKRERQSLVAILNRLGEHDQIIDFEDVQVDDSPYPFLAFEYMAGGSLEEWILNKTATRPALEPSEIVRQVAQGLADAHKKDIQHRDIKPANILLTGGPDPQVKIGDFGLAKVAATTGPRPEASFLASLAGTVGTLLYLPPEAQQSSFGRKAAQDDVFALGVVWFQLIMGAIERPPYDFATRLANQGTDSHTIRLIERCLAHPDRRFRDAGELLEAIGGNEIPPVTPCPAGTPDVQHLAREFLAGTLVNLA